MIQTIKHRLVARGPDSALVQSALKILARAKGLSIAFNPSTIALSRNKTRLLLQKRHLVYVPLFINGYETTFQHFEPTIIDGIDTLDFSSPALRTYRGSGLKLYCASLPEEDSMALYTRMHQPLPGETVWDVGANAGLTTYYFSKYVGETGRVIAWEPDAFNFEYLLKNIDLHALRNVAPLQLALSGHTGVAQFSMDGSTGAGLSEHLVYSECGNPTPVKTLGLEDACQQYGIPDFIKLDIEGGEVDVIEGGLPFINRTHPKISFSIETHRMKDGAFSEDPIKRMLESAGYSVNTSVDEYDQHFLWASYKDN